METKKTLELHLPSILGLEKIAMDFAASAAKVMKFPHERIDDLKTAVAEACTNAIEHGNNLDANTRVRIILTMEDAKLQVDVYDEGAGVHHVDVPDMDKKIKGKQKTRGWGVFLIEKLMDEVTFESKPEGGSVVKMVINLDKELLR